MPRKHRNPHRRRYRDAEAALFPLAWIALVVVMALVLWAQWRWPWML